MIRKKIIPYKMETFRIGIKKQILFVSVRPEGRTIFCCPRGSDWLS